MRPVNRRGRRSREEILEVASRLMAERGYAATSLSALGAETGLPKSAIYHHFTSKAGLLSAVMEQGLHDFFETMRETLRVVPQGDTPHERLSWLMQRTSEVFSTRREFLRLHMILILSSEAEEADVADTIRQVRTEGRALMNWIIREAFRDKGAAVAQAVADELDYFAIAGVDGAFIAQQADPDRALGPQHQTLADALAALGEAAAVRLQTETD